MCVCVCICVCVCARTHARAHVCIYGWVHGWVKELWQLRCNTLFFFLWWGGGGILYNFTPCGDTFWFVIAFTWFLWQVDTVISCNRMNKVLYIPIFFSFSANNLVHAIENTFTKSLPLPHPPPQNHHHHHQASQIFSKPSKEVTQAFKLGRSHFLATATSRMGGDGLCRETETDTERETHRERHTQRHTHRDRERRTERDTQRETERERETHTHTHTVTDSERETESLQSSPAS